MAELLDKRLNAFRDDLADIELKDKVIAPQYIQGEKAITTAAFLDLKKQPDLDAKTDKQLLKGEPIKIFETKSDWCWVQSERDNYVGYCHKAGLSPFSEPEYRVNALRSPVFEEPDLKTKILDFLPLNAEFNVAKQQPDSKFINLSDGGWVYRKHVSPIDEFPLQFIEAAKLYMGSPYIWGGNSDLGADCSGLVQMAARACGYDIPRDADQQEAFFSQTIGFEKIKAGDLLFWPGHVAIALNKQQAIHANASEMKTCIHEIDYMLSYIQKLDNVMLRSIKRPIFLE